MKKRITSILLAFLLCASLAVPAFAIEASVLASGSGGDSPLFAVANVVSEDVYYQPYDTDHNGGTPVYFTAAPTTLTVLGDFLVEVAKGAWLDDGYFDYENCEYMKHTSGSFVEPYPEYPIESYYTAGTVFTLEKGTYAVNTPPEGMAVLYLVVGGDSSDMPAKPVPPPPAPNPTAKPTASKILVNGKTVAFDAYIINGNNYFKLRDLAYALNGTDKQFEIKWDAVNNAITLIPHTPYTAVGGEMTGKGAGEKIAKPTTSSIVIDTGTAANPGPFYNLGEAFHYGAGLTVYIIEGNNYFKLREIGETFDFGTDWDGANQTIVIDTSKTYTPE
jgi:hypothetical protein